jgi:hypothetical protein
MINDIVFKTLSGLFNVSLFRASPAVLPYSIVMLVLLIFIEFLLKLVGFKIQGAPFYEIIPATLLYLGILIGGLYWLLARRKLLPRLHKLLMAIFGTELLLTAMLQLILKAFQGLGGMTDVTVMGAAVIVAFFVWILAIKTWALKSTLETTTPSAIFLTIGLYLMSSMPILLILGDYLQQPE